MSLFGWLRSSPHPHTRLGDSVWLTDPARLKGVIAQARAVVDQGGAAAIAAFTTSASLELKKAVGALPPQVLESYQLTPAHLSGTAHGAKSLSLFLVGCMADPDGEEKLLVQCKAVPFKISLQVHHSFPEIAQMGVSVGSLEALMKRMGLKEDEPVTSPMITRAIENVRRRRKS
jgi:hypothetical protein